MTVIGAVGVAEVPSAAELARHAPFVGGVVPLRLRPPNCAAALRVVYRSRGRTTTGLILLPTGRPPDGGWPIMTWCHCLMGLSRACAPSLIGATRRERGHLGDWLGRGFAVTVADYLGLDGWALNTFPVSAPLVADVLDIACAARSLGLPVSNRVVVAGFSQGASIALEAGARWRGWSDRIELCGSVALAPPAYDDFYRGSLHLGRAQVEQAVTMLVAVSAFHHPWLEIPRYLTDLGRRAVALSNTATVAEVGRFVIGRHNRDMGFSVLERRGLLDDVFAISEPPGQRYDRPVLICTTTPDPLSPRSWAGGYARRQRRLGSSVEVLDYRGQGHLTVVGSAAPDAIEWAAGVVAAAGRRRAGAGAGHTDPEH